MGSTNIDEFDEKASRTNRTCPDCGGSLRATRTETVCESCGLVVDEHRIDHGPEWRSFDDEDSTQRRTGGPLTVRRHDRGLSTEIGQDTDANGKPLSAKKRRQLGRLRREQTRGRFQSKAERNLAHGLGEVRRVASQLGVGDTVCDQACQLFRSAQNEDLLRGRSIEAIAAASVYGASRCNGRSRLLDEVAAVARVDASRVTNAYKTLNETLGLPTKPVAPKLFVPRLASKLDCPDGVRQRARALAEQAEAQSVTTGVHPAGFAAACLYKAAREAGWVLTQSEAAAVANASKATVRAHRDTLEEEVV